MKTSRWITGFVLGVSLVHAAEVEPQPFLAAAQRLIDSTSFLGTPFSDDEIITLKATIQSNAAAGAAKAQTVLDAHALFHVTITPEQRVKVERGSAKAVLDEAGWRQFLVRVTMKLASLRSSCQQSLRQRRVCERISSRGSQCTAQGPRTTRAGGSLARPATCLRRNRCPPTLSGLEVEYRIIQLYSRDSGKREASFAFDTGRARRTLGFRNEVSASLRLPPAHRGEAGHHRMKMANPAPPMLDP
jgi:hypothetical protein